MQFSSSLRLSLVEKFDKDLSIRRQCEILEVNRRRLYYRPREKNLFDIQIEDAIKFIYANCPFYGHRKVTKALRRIGFQVNRKKVRRIRIELGLKTIYPAPNLSKPKKQHKKYPYLLNTVKISEPNIVWATDITYIRLKDKGWVYVVAILDWYSRYILSHEVSISMEVDFCMDALQAALKFGKPKIFNSDQGSQFTSDEFTGELKKNEIRISMDSKGRYLDNIRMERFWRSLKYESVFLAEYETVKNVKREVASYIEFYNNERIHQSLDYYTPDEIYFRKEILKKP